MIDDTRLSINSAKDNEKIEFFALGSLKKVTIVITDNIKAAMMK